MKNRLLYNSLIGVVLMCLMAVLFQLSRGKPKGLPGGILWKTYVREIVESGTFTIEIDHANPMQGASRNLFPSYKLKIDGDKINYIPAIFRPLVHCPCRPQKPGCRIDRLSNKH
jgi:hypothetical protein